MTTPCIGMWLTGPVCYRGVPLFSSAAAPEGQNGAAAEGAVHGAAEAGAAESRSQWHGVWRAAETLQESQQHQPHSQGKDTSRLEGSAAGASVVMRLLRKDFDSLSGLGEQP